MCNKDNTLYISLEKIDASQIKAGTIDTSCLIVDEETGMIVHKDMAREEINKMKSNIISKYGKDAYYDIFK